MSIFEECCNPMGLLLTTNNDYLPCVAISRNIRCYQSMQQGLIQGIRCIRRIIKYNFTRGYSPITLRKLLMQMPIANKDLILDNLLYIAQHCKMHPDEVISPQNRKVICNIVMDISVIQSGTKLSHEAIYSAWALSI